MLLQMALFHSLLWLSIIPERKGESRRWRDGGTGRGGRERIHIFIIHSCVDGHLGYFHVLATVNSDTLYSLLSGHILILSLLGSTLYL